MTLPTYLNRPDRDLFFSYQAIISMFLNKNVENIAVGINCSP